MKIVDKREKSKKEYVFDDLCIGDCFLDQDGDVSIKISNEEHLVTMDGGKCWDICIADESEKVIPLDVTLIINGER